MPRIEFDQGSREASLRIEQLERQLMSRAIMTCSGGSFVLASADTTARRKRVELGGRRARSLCERVAAGSVTANHRGALAGACFFDENVVARPG
jgi:hypothetical protein